MNMIDDLIPYLIPIIGVFWIYVGLKAIRTKEFQSFRFGNKNQTEKHNGELAVAWGRSLLFCGIGCVLAIPALLLKSHHLLLVAPSYIVFIIGMLDFAKYRRAELSKKSHTETKEQK